MRRAAGLPAHWGVAAALVLLASSARAAHPMLTEDTGTQGAGRFELELGAEAARDGDVRAFQFAPQLSLGVLDNLDLILRPTWSSLRGVDAAGGGHDQGIGDTTFDVKWRFADFEASSFAVRGGFDAPTGAVAKSLGAGKPSAHAQLIATLDAAPFTVDANANYTRNPLPDERRDLYGFALAMVWAASARLRLTAEGAAATNPLAGHSTWPAVARFGAIATIASWLDLDIGYQTRLNHAAPRSVVLAGATIRW
jgi:hypothetical protein